VTVVRAGVAAALAMGLVTVGCGGKDESKEAAESEASTPQQALTQVRATRAGLTKALSTYRAGDHAAADRQVGDTYLEHFEQVEGPLEKADKELNEQLEDGIREELRGKMKADAATAEVQRLANEIMAGLDRAEAALR
jgi:hypothetical protein